MRALTLISAIFLLISFSPGFAQEKDRFYHLGADVVSEAIFKESGERRAIMIYASWCPYCRNAMPALIDIEKAKRGTILPVSVDQNPKKLLGFLNGLSSYPFPVIVIDEAKSGSLERYLGAPRRDGVPYYILLDERNDVFKAGTFNSEYIARYLLEGA